MKILKKFFNPAFSPGKAQKKCLDDHYANLANSILGEVSFDLGQILDIAEACLVSQCNIPRHTGPST